MRVILISLGTTLIAGSVFAQGLRETDTPFDADALNTQISGMVLEFYDGSRAYYGTEGRYEYRYSPEDAPFVGTFETRDSMVCVTFENGADRCDTLVDGGGRLVMIIADGTRFPVRDVTPWDEGS